MADIAVQVVHLSISMVPSSGAAAPYSGPRLLSVIKSGDTIGGGQGRIAGTIEEKATPNRPLRRRVRLHRDLDGLLVREAWSDAATGAYEFAGIDPAYRYTAIAYDYAHNHRAVVADNLTPEVLP